VLARLFCRFIVGACWGWHESQGSRSSEGKQDGRDLIPGTQATGTTTAHRVRPSLRKAQQIVDEVRQGGVNRFVPAGEG
jgi:hypothetical protein